MQKYQNPWDALAPNAPNKPREPTEWYDADNVQLAEPVILDYLTSRAGDVSNTRILDFGCGTGQFAFRLAEAGFTVDGLDYSHKMIAAAQAQYGSKVKFNVGGLEAVPSAPTYNAVVAIMVLQFIDDYLNSVERLAATLKPDGSLLMAVFNPAFISDWIKADDPTYIGFDSADNPTRGTLLFGDVSVPTLIRTAEQYNEVACRNGLSLELEAYPIFTPEFLDKYPVNGPTDHSEHMILGYRKV